MRVPSLLVALALVAVSCVGDATETTMSSSTTLETSTTTTGSATTTTTTTTTLVATTSTTLTPVTDLELGLFCRDLRPLGYSYAGAVQYWLGEGRPDRMDADRNGIPCETVYPESEVVEYWGEPLPTTTTPSRRYVVDEPTYFPESLPSAGEYYGSGCSPGSDTLPNGIWFGHIESASATSIQFDLICFAPVGPDEDGVGRLTNDNPKLRTVPIASSAKVHAIAPDGLWELQPYSSWHLDPGREVFCPPEGCWDVWLYINDRAVTEIVQIWFA
jgi:hypothetical protein